VTPTGRSSNVAFGTNTTLRCWLQTANGRHKVHNGEPKSITMVMTAVNKGDVEEGHVLANYAPGSDSFLQPAAGGCHDEPAPY
jgi:hypothetical protein